MGSSGSRPPLRVRYYPRRVGRRSRRVPLTPAQALRLSDDPARAQQARLTAELHELPTTDGGRVRRWLRRLLRGPA